ncbi:competence transcription factor [Listeria floridensis FSL S10-1187]|uniref:Competence transcription factor n=1 Tax=Listeria floridensis FSL S10-1187 TaxID=1265817 RepID=A0ABN0RI96_9LIST|nr:competence protein ComK [Listeria floridensis]EUJ33642.1 competence transcription factor [Listeria floridensis FSL S10-1187]
MKKTQGQQIYEVNPRTMIILPYRVGGSLYSEVLELGSHSISKFTPFELIKTSCKYFGANYDGRREGTRHLIGITHKPPIIIDPISFTYVFPTTSPLNPHCVWVFPQHIKDYRAADNNRTYIQFTNSESVILDLSLSSFNNQIARTSMLHMKFSQKMRKVEAKFPNAPMFFSPPSFIAENQMNYHFSSHNEFSAEDAEE